MPNVFNYAEKWADENLEILTQGMLTNPYIIGSNEEIAWSRGKTFHFTQMSVSGYKTHSRSGGWNAGTITQADVPFVITHDRDIEFMVDKADVDESNESASAQNVTNTFLKTQVAPEMDAYFYSTVATKALATAGLFTASAIATAYTPATVLGLLKGFLKAGRLRAYKSDGSLLMYVNSTVMDALELSTAFTRKIEMVSLAPDGVSLNTRVTDLDGVPIIEVIDDERFHTGFNYADGFVPAVGSFSINVLIASMRTVKTVPKISSIYFFAPGSHTKGDGYLYQNRAFWDTFIFPNGKSNVIDSIYCDRDTVAVI